MAPLKGAGKLFVSMGCKGASFAHERVAGRMYTCLYADRFAEKHSTGRGLAALLSLLLIVPNCYLF